MLAFLKEILKIFFVAQKTASALCTFAHESRKQLLFDSKKELWQNICICLHLIIPNQNS